MIDRSPVQVVFSDLSTFQFEPFLESLLQYYRWSEESILGALPVEIHYPESILDRIMTLQTYARDECWPAVLSLSAREQVNYLAYELVPRVSDDIVRGVRCLTVAAIQDDGSRALTELKEGLEYFLLSKVCSLARVLHSMWLEGEEGSVWASQFGELKEVYSPRVIYGLSVLARSLHDWAGWVDADIYLVGRRIRLFLPVFSTGVCDGDVLSPHLSRILIVPQIVEDEAATGVSIDVLSNTLLGVEGITARQVVYRNEVFLDSISCKDHYDARNWVARLVCDRLIESMLALSREEQKVELENLLLLDAHGIDIVDCVRRELFQSRA